MKGLIMMVGPALSGKSTTARKFEEGYKAVIVSSDSIREEIYGDESIQGNPQEVFELAHSRVMNSLQKNELVVFDATNVSAKHRMGLLGKLPACVERTAMVHVVAPHVLLARNKLRERKVPGDVIWRQIRRFEYPTLGEQFDAIYPFVDSHNVLDIDQILDSMFKFDQDNLHHRFSLGEHSYRAAEYMATVSKNHNLIMAALLHDVGKLYTKTYKNHKGEPTEGAHYYSHGNVSGYLSQLIKHDLPKEQLKKYPLAAHLSQKIINWEYVAKLTNYHMQPYFSKTEKSINRWKRRLGADLWEDLLLLHEADKFAH